MNPPVRVLLRVLELLLDAWVQVTGGRYDMETRELARMVLLLIALLEELKVTTLSATASSQAKAIDKELRAWIVRFNERTRAARDFETTVRGKAALTRESGMDPIKQPPT